jgi:predicted TPR repeat methyltransferase
MSNNHIDPHSTLTVKYITYQDSSVESEQSSCGMSGASIVASTPLDPATLSARRQKLVDFLKEKPRNARAMAKLACLLQEQYIQSSTFAPVDINIVACTEALTWAHRAIDVAPHKPYGYAALSLIHPNETTRMEYVRQALTVSTDPTHWCARIGLRVRLLTEPRACASRRSRGTIGRASVHHPSRRPLDDHELALYKQLCHDLPKDYTNTTTISSHLQVECAMAEFRLGLFFRKMLPLEESTRQAKYHLQRAWKGLPLRHPKKCMAQFWLATLSNTSTSNSSSNGSNDSVPTTIDKCPPEYIVGLYSTFADRFDDLLVHQLHYQTPSLVHQLLDSVSALPRQWNRAADLGCGTGLSGMAFNDCVTHVTGVDLSPEMLDKARLRKCYDNLVQGDITTILGPSYEYDLILACDVFVYLGDLQHVFAQAYESIVPGGMFCFSTELLTVGTNDTPESLPPYQLHECARFAHSQQYVDTLAASVGFTQLASRICTIRTNQGRPVDGYLVVLTVEALN